MAAGGASAEIVVTLSSGFSVAQARSSNPSVASFTLQNGGTLVDVVSGTPGDAQLQLIDGAGHLVDEITVSVVATAKLAVMQGWAGSAPIILAGSSQFFHVTTEDANGAVLIGSGAVKFDLGGSLSIGSGLPIGDMVYFTGTAGSGTITAHTPTVMLTQAITVVPASAITSLSATTRPNPNDATSIDVDVVANSAGGAVYGASCAWNVSDPSVTMTPAFGSLEEPAKSSATFHLARAGSFSATCTVGAQSTTVQLTR